MPNTNFPTTIKVRFGKPFYIYLNPTFCDAYNIEKNKMYRVCFSKKDEEDTIVIERLPSAEGDGLRFLVEKDKVDFFNIIRGEIIIIKSVDEIVKRMNKEQGER